MINPFDKTFFKFLLGFTVILTTSFAVIFFTGKYSDILDGTSVNATVKK